MPKLKPTRGIRLNKTHPLVRGLAGYWLLNAGTGDKVFDLSGNGNDATLQGTAPSWSAGKFGSAVLLPGTDEYMKCGNSATVNPSFQVTVIVWFKWAGSTSQFLIAKGEQGVSPFNNQYFLSTRTNNVIRGHIYTTATGHTNIESAITVNDNKWHQVALTYDGSFVNLYIDGVLDAGAVAKTGTMVDNGIELTLGARITNVTPTGFFDGLIDHVLLYNRALLPFEIALLYIKPFVMFEPSLNIARISSVVANGFVEIAGDLAALSFLTDSAALKRARGIAGGVAAQSSLAGAIKVSKKISGVIAATSSLSGALSLVGEVSRSRGSGFKPIEGAERLRGLRRSAFY